MIKLILRRILGLIPLLFFASIIVFLMLHLIPGDAVSYIVGIDATEEQREAVREEMGLNEPLHIQYGIWLGNILEGDLGKSVVSHLPVTQLISDRLPATIELTFFAMLFAVVFAIPLGIIAALWNRTILDYALSVVTSIGLSVPEYWSGLLAIIVFAVHFRLLPPGGRIAPQEDLGLWVKSLILPAITLGFPIGSMQARFVRASMIEIMREQYTLTATSKGLRRSTIVFNHAFRNALIPLMTVVGIQTGRMMGGAILVESIYNWPGVGRMIVQAITQRDYPLVQAIVLLIVIIFSLVNLAVDIMYGIVDPRIRISEHSDR